MGKIADALKKFRELSEPRWPVELATVIGDGSKPGYAIVAAIRPDGSAGEQKEVRTNKVVWPGVIVRVSTQRLEFGEEEQSIVGVDADTYGSTPTMPVMIGEHGLTHGYQQGDEASWLHPYQSYPLRVQPLTGLTVRVQGGLYYASGSFYVLIDPLDVDLTPSQPGGSDERWVLLSLTAAGSITLSNGVAAATVQRTSIPSPPVGEYPVGAVRLGAADTTILRTSIDDIRHLRPFVADVLPSLGTAYQRLRVNAGATALEQFTDQAGIVVLIDGGGAPITTGSKGYLTIPFDCKVIGFYILGDHVDNSIVVDVKYVGAFPTTPALPVTVSITGGDDPTLDQDGSNSDLSLTNWTTQVLAQGGVLEFVVDSVGDTDPERVSITLVVEKR